MIENFYLDEWRQQVPWLFLYQIEQDLIISRALVNLYENQKIKNSLVFRGGTALHKIYFKPSGRYSEDIDFVQIKPEPIGDTIRAIRQSLDHWLGEPKRKLTERSVKLIYQYPTQENRTAKLKIEINTTEHFQVLDLVSHEFNVKSQWFSGKAQLTTYQLDELMGTKLRALYQRRKGRDLYDVWKALSDKVINCENVVKIFNAYCQHDGKIITRAMYEKNLYEKLLQKDFGTDIGALITANEAWVVEDAYKMVLDKLIGLLPGESWKIKRNTDRVSA